MAPGPRDDAQVAQLAHDVWTWARYQDPVLNWCVRRSRSFPFPLHDALALATVNRQPSTVNRQLLRPLPSPSPCPRHTPGPPCCCRHAAEVLLGAALSVGAPPTLTAISAHFLETTANDGLGADQQIDALAQGLYDISSNDHALTNW